MARVLSVDPNRLKGRILTQAADEMRRGGVIIYPTDTIYGLGCDITQKGAIERIRRIKGRDAKKPMSFVCADLTNISRYAQVSNFAYRVLKHCLPGPYTFVLPATKETPRILQTKQKTVGIRVPDHPVALGLVAQLGGPIISTSANRSTQEVISDPEELESEMGHEVDIVLECGPLPLKPSSVVSLVGDRVEILRAGGGDMAYLEDLAAG
jgi:tRNA threonylcarbamoyl adenosine modification protein (Sua5/YciO/YrdC/YwlC family)